MEQLKYNVINGNYYISIPTRLLSDNVKGFITELNDFLQEKKIRRFFFDALETKYISSVGLREFLRLKQRGYFFEIINVNKDGYEILQKTGFSEIFTVRRVLREISTEGLELMARGSTANVYRLDEDKIVKVFPQGYTFDEVRMEIDKTKRAFVSGIDVPISYDMVKVKDSYGIVYEMIDAVTLAKELNDHLENEDEYVRQYTDLMKYINKIEIGKDVFTNVKSDYLSKLKNLEGKNSTSRDVTEKMYKLIEAAPDEDFFIHDDYNPKNILYKDGELILIDFGRSSYGHPVFEFMGFGAFYILAGVMDDDYTIKSVGMKKDQIIRTWEKFLRLYFPDADEERLEKIENVCLCYSSIRAWIMASLLPVKCEPALRFCAENFMKYYEAGGKDTEILNCITE